MNKRALIIVLLVFIMVVTGCKNDAGNIGISAKKGSDSENTQNIDIDLTALSSTMIYSEVYNMMISPDNYLGKTIKMSGSFSVYQDPNTQKYYFACVIADATACCSQGIEFVLDGDYSYPDDYPEMNSQITVTGIFDVYEEGEYKYCQLINARLG